jgi:hypothetical protein
MGMRTIGVDLVDGGGTEGVSGMGGRHIKEVDSVGEYE